MSGVYAVVLGAGAGARFGGGKLTAPFRGGVLIDAALAVAANPPVAGVVLVVGAEAEAVEARATGLGIAVTHAPDYAQGMAASLKAGIAALPDHADGVLIFLGDMPDIPPGIAGRLVGALQAGAEAAVPVCEGRRGHPVGFARSQFAALQALDGDRGARAVLDALGDRLVEVPTADRGVLTDIDTPDQLRALDGA